MPTTERIQGGLIPLWMLCDASTVDEKIAFMRHCRGGGIRALAAHARSGNLIPFGGTEWFGMIKALVAEAARLDMKLWLYDEDPYPSGAAGGSVMAARPELRSRAMLWVEAPSTLMPGDPWHIDQRHVIWAGLVPLEAGQPARDLTAAVGAIRADWFSVEWDSRHYYARTPIFPCVRGGAVRMVHALRTPVIPPGFKLAAVVETFTGLDGPWGSLPDLLQRETFDVFTRLGLEPYREAVGGHFGTTIPGVFTDEAKPHGNMPYTQDLFAAFQAQFGYALAPRLFQLFGEPLDEVAVRTRLDYRQWIMDRFLNAFVHPYRAWCEAQGLHLAGHFSPEDDPIQETACLPSCMPIMKAMGLPGCDVIVPAVGDETCPTLNLGSLRAGSIKSQTGRRYGTSESQALGDWIITSRQTRQIYAWQKVLGIDRFFTHGFWNSLDGVTNLEAPPDYGPNSSIFRGTAAVNAWLEQCDAIMDGGHEVANVAVLDNITAFWDWAPGIDTTAMEKWRQALWFTILHCLQAHIGIHALDSADAATGTVGANGLVIGKRTYDTVLVPATGIMTSATFRRLCEAAASGTRVIWFGGGPSKWVEASGPLVAAPVPTGEIRREGEPSLAWCRQQLAAQVTVRGAQAQECYVRRFHAEDGTDRLFAVNLAKEARVFTLANAGGAAWVPDPVLTDGDAVTARGALRWNVPAYGCGMFTLGAVPVAARTATVRRPVTADITFERLGVNVLRLDRCQIILKGRPPQHRPYPQPFWQRFPDYQAREVSRTFAGELPVESTVAESDLRYRFTFTSGAALKNMVLVLDPRCARGRFQVFCNDQRVSKWLSFPLAHITPLRLRLSHVRQGRNNLEFRFTVKHAMEGLLSTLWIEGDFGVWLRKDRPVVKPDGRGAVSSKGWLDMGLAHYMGDGVYRWSETFSEREVVRNNWALELDDIVDSAALRLNGLDLGTRAWGPWRWPLCGLRQGSNAFELTVSSTAGNKLSLCYPAQPQGWIGTGCLRSVPVALRACTLARRA